MADTTSANPQTDPFVAEGTLPPPALGFGRFARFGAFLASLEPLSPAGVVAGVSIQFPDPWFKRRHRKRRVLQPALLLAIADALQPGRTLFLQSDVKEVIEPMVELTELSGCFDRPIEDARPWRTTNPLPVPTEREQYVQAQQLPVYRVLYRRNHRESPLLEELESRCDQLDNPSDPEPPGP